MSFCDQSLPVISLSSITHRVLDKREHLLRRQEGAFTTETRGSIYYGDKREHLLRRQEGALTTETRGSIYYGDKREHLLWRQEGAFTMETRGSIYYVDKREHLLRRQEGAFTMQTRGSIYYGDKREHLLRRQEGAFTTETRGSIYYGDKREHLLRRQEGAFTLRDGSDEGSYHMISMRNWKIIIKCSFLSRAVIHYLPCEHDSSYARQWLPNTLSMYMATRSWSWSVVSQIGPCQAEIKLIDTLKAAFLEQS